MLGRAHAGRENQENFPSSLRGRILHRIEEGRPSARGGAATAGQGTRERVAPPVAEIDHLGVVSAVMRRRLAVFAAAHGHSVRGFVSGAENVDNYKANVKHNGFEKQVRMWTPPSPGAMVGLVEVKVCLRGWIYV